jgi:hypothetical protein
MRTPIMEEELIGFIRHLAKICDAIIAVAGDVTMLNFASLSQFFTHAIYHCTKYRF